MSSRVEFRAHWNGLTPLTANRGSLRRVFGLGPRTRPRLHLAPSPAFDQSFLIVVVVLVMLVGPNPSLDHSTPRLQNAATSVGQNEIRPPIETPDSTITEAANVSTPEWSNVTSSINPQPAKRYGEGLAYDPFSNETVMFGGYSDEYGPLNDTWVLRGNTWTQLTEPIAPSPRYGDLAMAYDPGENGVLLFGASPLTAIKNDTWLFDGASWINLNSTVAPPLAYPGPLAWDPALSGMLYVTTTTPMQTWLFSHNSWQNLDPVSEPASVILASMAYDPAQSAMVLFGGQNSSISGVFSNVTWVFAEGKWTIQPEATSPSPRQNAELVTDPLLDSLVLFGGMTFNSSQEYFNDTWLYHAGTWEQIHSHSTPPALWLSAGTYVAPRAGILLFDGQNLAGQTLSEEWQLNLSVLNVTGSVSTPQRRVPFPVWLNSTVVGGQSPYDESWVLSNGEFTDTQNAVESISAVGNVSINLTVIDADRVSVNLTFAIQALPQVTYNVTFGESGLAPDINWSVTLNGALRSSETNQISFNELNGSYYFSVGSVTGYLANLSSGTLRVNGSSLTEAIAFAASSRLPSGSGSGGSSGRLLDYVILGVGAAAVAIGIGVAMARRSVKGPKNPST